MKRLQIAMVSEHASPLALLGGRDAGGQNVHVAALAGALADRGHRVAVYTRRDQPDQPDRVLLRAGVEVVHVPAGPATPLEKDLLLPHMPAFGDWLGRELAARPADVVHAHFWMSGLAAQRAIRALGTPIAQTFHALGAVKRRHQVAADTSPPQRVELERDLARRASVIIATCRDEVSELLAEGADPHRLRVVPCGVEPDRFTPEGPALAPWRPGAGRLLSLGRLVERKGIDTVIQSLALIPDAELVVAGGPERAALEADPDVRRLLATAHAVGVADRVRFVGRVDAATAAALLRGADLLVSVPWYEPFGIVPLEAMACGTPVVASAVGGMLDTVIDGQTGALVPPREPAALAVAVRRLLADPRRRARCGANGRARVLDGYCWSHVAEATEQIYLQLTGSAPRPPATPESAWLAAAR